MSGVPLRGARVVITGAGGGIGTATALRFAEQEGHVILVDNDRAAGVVSAEKCATAGARADSYCCDVSDAAAVEALAEELEGEHGPVDVLVNNAGVGIAGPFLDASLDDWQWLRGVNLDGVVHGCHAFGRRMVTRRRGHVVNVASGAAYLPNRNLAAYCATKAAVVSLSQCLRADWRRHGVGVSVVCPGVISTPIASRTRYRGTMSDKQMSAERALALGHSPDLVARVILDCVRRNRDVVPVGIESAVAYKLLRGAPQPIQGLIARAQMP